jgi:pilus assembly protein CpaD
MTIVDAAHGPRCARFAALALLALGATVVASCSESPRLSSEEAWGETSAAHGHPIEFVEKNEILDVELPPHRQGLSRNQYVDVYRFATRYKEEATGPLAISHAGRRSGSGVIADVRRALEDAGIDPSRIVRGGKSSRHVVTLAYHRPVAVAPQCGHWPRDVGQERERVHYPDFGCSTQRNLAAMVVNPRDLMGSQPETPASSERRGRVWSKYIGGDTAATSQASGAGNSAASDAPPKATKK